jgi:hypothetical protein
MKILFFVIMFLISAVAPANTIIKQNCLPENPNGPFVYWDDFKWGLSFEEMMEKFNFIYSSDKRLKKRAYLDQVSNKILFPYNEVQGGPIEIPPKFIENVSRHITEGFKYEYIDAVFFPDMGHSHFLIPLDIWNSKYKDYQISETSKFYTDLFSEPELKILYHTAEQLKTTENDKPLDDRHLQWRFHTRNLVGKNSENSDIKIIQNKSSTANTLSELDGYYYYGSGFILSANRGGCFSYSSKNQTFYFDLSMYDLESSKPIEDQKQLRLIR